MCGSRNKIYGLIPYGVMGSNVRIQIIDGLIGIKKKLH